MIDWRSADGGFGTGATDDGTAIVSILQIIKSFTRPESMGGKRVKRGLIALLNNGEEDYLVGVERCRII
jgi:hypothetical protein